MTLRTHTTPDFLKYLAHFEAEAGTSEDQQLPSLHDLSKELGISVASLREQLEVAKALGLVEVRPRTGIRRLPYTFFPAVSESLTYAISRNPVNFELFSQLRNHVEASFYREAVDHLFPGDIEKLKMLLAQAWQKLHGVPVQIPHPEHRQLHQTIFQRLQNPFVTGIIDAFWEAYEAVGLNLYADYDYLQLVWGYHQKMVDTLASGDIDSSYDALVTHKDLLHHRPRRDQQDASIQNNKVQPVFRKENP